jgi:hypothetical protein
MSADGNPVVFSVPTGKGGFIYIDLDLSHQLMNIQRGAFRLLANALAFQFK